MKARLVPCPACRRHVRLDSGTCPFCNAETVALENAPLPEVGSVRLGSLALMTFRVTALGVALNACGGETGPKPPPANTGGAPAQGGADSGTSGSGGSPVIETGGSPNTGFGGSDPIGGNVSIYRATPKG